MRYVALRELKVGDDIRDRGDEVPEAADWPDRRPWVSNFYIEEVPDALAEQRMAELKGEVEEQNRMSAINMKKQDEEEARRAQAIEAAKEAAAVTAAQNSRTKAVEAAEAARAEAIAKAEREAAMSKNTDPVDPTWEDHLQEVK